MSLKAAKADLRRLFAYFPSQLTGLSKGRKVRYLSQFCIMSSKYDIGEQV